MIRWAVSIIWIQILIFALIALLTLPFAFIPWLILSMVTARDLGSWLIWWLFLTVLVRSLPFLTSK